MCCNRPLLSVLDDFKGHFDFLVVLQHVLSVHAGVIRKGGKSVCPCWLQPHGPHFMHIHWAVLAFHSTPQCNGPQCNGPQWPLSVFHDFLDLGECSLY